MLNVAKDFAQQEVKPVALQIDETDEFPTKLFKRAGELGFPGITIPTEYGGLGLDHITAALIYEEIAKVSPVLTVNIGAHAMLAAGMIQMLGSPAQKEKYLTKATTGEYILACGSTESSGGDNHVEHTTRAVLEGDAAVIVRRLENTIENVMVKLPAVISVLPQIAPAPVPGLRDILAAGKKPVSELDAGGLSGVESGVTELSAKGYTMDRKNIMLEGGVEEQARSLIVALKKEGVF
jgi:hypothetical protein